MPSSRTAAGVQHEVEQRRCRPRSRRCRRRRHRRTRVTRRISAATRLDLRDDIDDKGRDAGIKRGARVVQVACVTVLVGDIGMGSKPARAVEVGLGRVHTRLSWHHAAPTPATWCPSRSRHPILCRPALIPANSRKGSARRALQRPMKCSYTSGSVARNGARESLIGTSDASAEIRSGLRRRAGRLRAGGLCAIHRPRAGRRAWRATCRSAARRPPSPGCARSRPCTPGRRSRQQR